MTLRRNVTWLVAGAIAVRSMLGTPAFAEVTFQWATVGNPGNAADTLVMTKGPAADNTTGYGSVGYAYQISKYDVTNAQYVEFLNKVDPTGGNSLKLYRTQMSDAGILGVASTGGIDFTAGAADGTKYTVKSGQGNFPVVWVNWVSSARFVNWLSNGQGSAGTESGVYDMSLIPLNGPGLATPPPRASGAQIFLPSENEFYKAAYYDPTKNGGAGGYWQYGTQSDTAPASVAPPGDSNSANIGSGAGGGGGTASTLATTGAAYDSGVTYLTDVGAYSSATSYYGLYDLDGLIWNWTEATRSSFGNQLPVYRGGSWRYGEGFAGAAFRNTVTGANVSNAQFQFWGLRVAAVPEPSSVVLAISGAGAAYGLVRRKRRRAAAAGSQATS
jgi:formylglycine-generating enzyme required for sulfatase activity